jgi:hypothetical protein
LCTRDKTSKFVVIDPKELDPDRARNMIGGQEGVVLLRNLRPKKNSNGIAAVMAHSLPGSSGGASARERAVTGATA